MSLARYCLFKTFEGASVGAIGATLVNVAASFIGVEGVDIGKIASIMAVGSILYGFLRDERHLTNGYPIKYDNSSTVVDLYHRNDSNLTKVAVITAVHATGNTIYAGLGFSAYSSLALLGLTQPDLYNAVKLLLCAGAGSVVEAGCHHQFRQKRAP